MPDPDELTNSEEMTNAQRELAEATARAAELEGKQHSLELERMGEGGALNAEQMRAEMESIEREMQRVVADVERASSRVQKELELQVRRIRREVDAKMKKVNDTLAPVQKKLDLMREGIETLGLYLSAAEGVVTIREGERADALEPLVIRQMVLSMDEESSLFAEDGGMTADDVEEFDQWLLADPQNVDQVIPERKSVVALVARWRERDSANPFSHDPDDKVTHFLIRNGDALFRTTVNDFVAGRALVPRTEEFLEFFRVNVSKFDRRLDDNEFLTPGTKQYAQAMEESDRRVRHYLRIGLILQGLVDNSEVFAPLHPAGISIIKDMASRSDEKVRVIHDTEGGLGSGLETFRQWQHRINKELRPGMRIIGTFHGESWRDANHFEATGMRPDRGHVRVSPMVNGVHPPSGVPLLIEQRKPDGSMVVRFERTDKVYDPEMWRPDPDRPGYGRYGGERKAKTRASLTIFHDDDFILAYDAIESSEQLRGFLASRQNRREYQKLWPLIRAAMFAVKAEEEAEAPFRQMLAGVLARENNVTVEQAQADIPDLVRWFKTKNRWTRPLTATTMASLEAEAELDDADAVENQRTAGGRLTSAALDARSARLAAAGRGVSEYAEDAYNEYVEAKAAEKLLGQEHEAKAVRMIVDEHRRRLEDRRRPINEQLVERLRAEHPDALLIARPRRGGYLVITAADNHNLWTHQFEYDTRGSLKEQREWVLLRSDSVSRLTVCYRNQRFDNWELHATENVHLRATELEQLGQRLGAGEHSRSGEHPMMVSFKRPTARRPGYFTVWSLTDKEAAEAARRGDFYRYIARDIKWERGDNGLQLIANPYDNGHQWTVARSQDTPWSGEWSSKHVGEIVWGPDQERVTQWRRLHNEHTTEAARTAEVKRRAYELSSTIVDQFYATENRKLYEQFLTDVPDARWDEWTEHLGKHGSQWEWGFTHHDSHGHIGEVIRWLVDRGEDPTGMTCEEAFAHAKELGLPKSWVPVIVGMRKFPEHLPQEYAHFVIGAEAQGEPTAEEHQERVGHLMPQPEPSAEELRVVMKLADGVEVLDPHQPGPERDEFDELRDALRDIIG